MCVCVCACVCLVEEEVKGRANIYFCAFAFVFSVRLTIDSLMSLCASVRVCACVDKRLGKVRVRAKGSL